MISKEDYIYKIKKGSKLDKLFNDKRNYEKDLKNFMIYIGNEYAKPFLEEDGLTIKSIKDQDIYMSGKYIGFKTHSVLEKIFEGELKKKSENGYRELRLNSKTYKELKEIEKEKFNSISNRYFRVASEISMINLTGFGLYNVVWSQHIDDDNKFIGFRNNKTKDFLSSRYTKDIELISEIEYREIELEMLKKEENKDGK